MCYAPAWLCVEVVAVRAIRDYHLMWGDTASGEPQVISMPCQIREQLLGVPIGHTAGVSSEFTRQKLLGNAWHGALVMAIAIGASKRWASNAPKMVVTPFGGIELLMWGLGEVGVLKQVCALHFGLHWCWLKVQHAGGGIPQHRG